MNDFVLEAAPAPARGVTRWLREGLRAAYLRAPRTGGAAPHPRELVLLAIIAIGIELVLGRLEVPGPAEFSLRGWLAPWWGLSAAVLLLWTLLSLAPGAARQQGGVAAWFALWLVACIPPGIVAQTLGI